MTLTMCISYDVFLSSSWCLLNSFWREQGSHRQALQRNQVRCPLCLGSASRRAGCGQVEVLRRGRGSGDVLRRRGLRRRLRREDQGDQWILWPSKRLLFLPIDFFALLFNILDTVAVPRVPLVGGIRDSSTCWSIFMLVNTHKFAVIWLTSLEILSWHPHTPIEPEEGYLLYKSSHIHNFSKKKMAMQCFTGLCWSSSSTTTPWSCNHQNLITPPIFQIIPANCTPEEKSMARQCYEGLLWSKQFYHYIVESWLGGGGGDMSMLTLCPPPPPTAIELEEGDHHLVTIFSIYLRSFQPTALQKKKAWPGSAMQAFCGVSSSTTTLVRSIWGQLGHAYTAIGPENGYQNIFSCNDFFFSSSQIIPANCTPAEKSMARQCYAGLLWSKQFYHYIVESWLGGDQSTPTPPESRKSGRNTEWKHLFNRDIISMPDKWEYPWVRNAMMNSKQGRTQGGGGGC